MNTGVTEVITRVGKSFLEGDCPDPQMFQISGPGANRTAFRRIGVISLSNLSQPAGPESREKVLDTRLRH